MNVVGSLYLAALVFGFGVLALQFVSAGAGEAGDASEASDGSEGHTGHHEPPGGALGIFLKLRFWSYGLLAFGLLGSLLHFLDLASTGVTAGLAALIGLACGIAAVAVFRLLERHTSDSALTLEAAVGRVGRVILPCGRERSGKVRLELHGSTLDLLARGDEELLEAGATVLVVSVTGSTATVTRAPKDVLAET